MKKSLSTALLSLVPWLCLAAISGHASAADSVPVTDPAVLKSMGLPADATNVFALTPTSALPPETRPKDFGTVVQYTALAPKAFIGRENVGNSWQYSGGDVDCCESLTAKGTEDFADAQLLLPDGALFDGIRFWGHDSNAASNLAFFIFETCHPSFGAGARVFTTIGSSDPVTTGSSGYQSSFTNAANRTINNRDCIYTARIRFDATTGLTLQKIRIQWFRQISPAPATATFTDVPTTDPSFRAVEALAASGITLGCSATQFCPTATLTRAQMALFLARALGL